MTGQQIKQKIEDLNTTIKMNLNPCGFVLDNDISICIEEIRKLQTICTHETDGAGHCRYCGITLKEDK